MCEFLGGFTPILMNPRESLSLIKKDQRRHLKSNFMQGFLRAYERNFNPSQISALTELPKMLEDSLLLIQGPVSVFSLMIFQPGTGKTQTITGMVAMLISANVDKILICAPSNAAIDEIITRVSTRGLLGQKL